MLLDVSDRLIVIVGGGAVAARKAAGVIDAGATRVRVISPEFRADFDPAIDFVQETYHPANLDGAGLVFAATDSAHVNEAVVRDAHERGLLVCRADNDEDQPGDFITPAQFVSGNVHVTVSAGSAALAATIRDGIGQRWRRGWSEMAVAMQTLRPLVVQCAHLQPVQRREIFRSLASIEAIELLESKGAEALQAWLAEKHPELNHAPRP